MQMSPVGPEDILPVLHPPHDGKREIEDRHAHDQQRDDQGDGGHALEHAMNSDRGEDEAQQHRTRVAHEDGRREEVVPQEAQGGAGEDRGEDAGLGRPREMAMTSKVPAAMVQTTASQPIHAVDEVDDIDQCDDP